MMKAALSIIEDIFGFDALVAYARTDSSATCRVLGHLGFVRLRQYWANGEISYWFYVKERQNG